MYSNGEGIPENDREAVKWFRLAAEHGFSDAQLNLGIMYSNGEGVPENDREAVKWVRLAAEQGAAEAQFQLALKVFFRRRRSARRRESLCMDKLGRS